MPSERSERITSQAARRAAGSKPVVGSSRNSTSGSPIESEAEVEPALLSARERAHALASRFSSRPTRPITLVDVQRLPVVPGEELEALARRVRFGYIADDWRTTPMRSRQSQARPLRVLVEHGDRAAVARAVALEDLDRRRLAGAVRTEQAEHLARLDLEVDRRAGPRTSRTTCAGR